MYSSCSGILVTDIEEVKELIDRFYKKAGRTAEASGAETMLPYMEQRDKRNQELEEQISDRYTEVNMLRRDVEKWKDEASRNDKLYYTAMNQMRDAETKAIELKTLLTKLTQVKGFNRYIPKSLRESIKKAIG